MPNITKSRERKKWQDMHKGEGDLFLAKAWNESTAVRQRGKDQEGFRPWGIWGEREPPAGDRWIINNHEQVSSVKPGILTEGLCRAFEMLVSWRAGLVTGVQQQWLLGEGSLILTFLTMIPLLFGNRINSLTEYKIYVNINYTQCWHLLMWMSSKGREPLGGKQSAAKQADPGLGLRKPAFLPRSAAMWHQADLLIPLQLYPWLSIT